MGDVRVAYIADKIAETFGLDAIAAQTALGPHMNRVWQFFEPAGSPKLIFLHQVLEVENAAGDLQSEDDTPQLILTNGEVDRVHGAALYFLRINPKAWRAERWLNPSEERS
mmetsp:Transcript_7615/g.11968  ORF Transcript_7615/g.11968 Transcript_7615/m.11968 type:complete len:111 (+) Transcript_7615:263-595(+)